MGRHTRRRNNEQWFGVISCARPRCREEHEWPMHAEPVDLHTLLVRQTPEQRDADAVKRWDWNREIAGHPLPANWVRLYYMEYREDLSGNPGSLEFHSPHCAALYLDSLPEAKGNRDPRRINTNQDLRPRSRRHGGDPILRAGGP